MTDKTKKAEITVQYSLEENNGRTLLILDFIGDHNNPEFIKLYKQYVTGITSLVSSKDETNTNRTIFTLKDSEEITKVFAISQLSETLQSQNFRKDAANKIIVHVQATNLDTSPSSSPKTTDTKKGPSA